MQCRYCGALAILCFGTLMQAAMLPEILKEGNFDLYGASHQICHVCTVAALVMYHDANVHLWEHLARLEASKALQALADSGADLHLCTSPTFLSCGDSSVEMYSIPDADTFHSAELRTLESSKTSAD